MKNFKAIFLTAVVLIAASSVNAQTRFVGNVVEVVNGRTVVIDTDGRKLTAQIEFIEVPEPDQPLHQTVRDHLAKLVLGKTVEFHPHGITPGRTAGQLFVNSVDIALQMLRDGAAWQVPAQVSGQNERESSAYQYHQNQARVEKRGVWGVKDMKPAWEFRAAQWDRGRQERIANEGFGDTRTGENAKKAGRRATGPWSDDNPFLKDPGPLVHGYNAASRTGYVGTSLMGVAENETLPPGHKMAVDITYLYKQEDKKGRSGKFVVTVFSMGDQVQFLQANALKVMVDEKAAFVGKPVRTTGKEDGKTVEKLTYEVNKAAIEKMVYGGSVSIEVGKHLLVPTQGVQLLLYNMLQVSN